jgi:hypothetical protein
MIVTRKAYRKAVYGTLLLSLFGLALVSLSVIGSKGAIHFTIAFYPQVVVGYALIVLIIELAGIPLRSALSRYWVGALFAISLFITGVIAGSASSMAFYHDANAFSYIVKPLFWLSAYGLIPAAIIGFIGTGLLRVINKMQNKASLPTGINPTTSTPTALP